MMSFNVRNIKLDKSNSLTPFLFLDRMIQSHEHFAVLCDHQSTLDDSVFPKIKVDDSMKSEMIKGTNACKLTP